MIWNWQQKNWPRFSWKSEALTKAEELFLVGSGIFLGTVKHLDATDKDQLTIEAMSNEALTSSEIEGEILDRASVQSSIRHQLGIKGDHKQATQAEHGMAELMVDLYRSFKAPLSHNKLFSWHRMLMAYRQDLKVIGRYRSHNEPMQVVSGNFNSLKIHFEAPPSSKMNQEMSRFIQWFNQSAPKGKIALPPLTRAGIAHLYFVSIHPFEDGNGRIGRAISEKSLAQSLSQPTFTALAATMLAKKKNYYEALEKASHENEITEWLLWFSATAIEAQRRTTALVEFLIEKTKLLDRFRGQLNDRQGKALIRILKEGPHGFKGGLSASKYMKITSASAATATRDLTDMVVKKILIRTGELRHARYHINMTVKPVSPISFSSKGEIL